MADSCCSNRQEIPSHHHETSSRDWVRFFLTALVATWMMLFSVAMNLTPPAGKTKMILHGVMIASLLILFFLVGTSLFHEARAQLLKKRVVMEQFLIIAIFSFFIASLHSSWTGLGHAHYEISAFLLAVHSLGSLVNSKKTFS